MNESIGRDERISVSELARRAAVSVPTIKFYIREGVLPAGLATSRTRASYGYEHLARLRLIRALLDVGGVSLATVKSVVELIESGTVDGEEVIRSAIRALGPAPRKERDGGARARADVEALVQAMGWQVDLRSPAIDLLAEALTVLRAAYGETPAIVLAPYAEVAAELAQQELLTRPVGADTATLVEWAVTGTVAFEQVLTGWRRLAHEDLSRRAASPGGTTPDHPGE